MARAALILAVLATSWGSILVRLCASAPLTVAFYRLGMAAALTAPWGARAAGRGSWTPRLAGAAGGAGALLALHFAAWISSLSYTTIWPFWGPSAPPATW